MILLSGTGPVKSGKNAKRCWPGSTVMPDCGARALLGLTSSAVHQELDRIAAASTSAAAAAVEQPPAAEEEAAAPRPAPAPAVAVCTPQLRAELDREARATALRLGIEFVPGAGEEPDPEPEPEPSGAFASGQRVVISGLTGAPELNGSTGLVEDFNESKGRYSINLAPPGGARRAVGVKPQNLSLIASFPPDAPSAAASSARPAAAAAGAAEVVEKVYKDAVYLSVLAHGLSVCLKPPPGADTTPAPAVPVNPDTWDGWVVAEVFLYNQGVDGYERYQSSALPDGLSWEQTNGDIVGEWYATCLLKGTFSYRFCLHFATFSSRFRSNWDMWSFCVIFERSDRFFDFFDVRGQGRAVGEVWRCKHPNLLGIRRKRYDAPRFYRRFGATCPRLCHVLVLRSAFLGIYS